MKLITLVILSLILTLALSGCAVYYYAPQFGASQTDIHENTEYVSSNQYVDMTFRNQVEIQQEVEGNMFSTLLKFIKGVPNDRPDMDITPSVLESTQLTKFDTDKELIWLGHSSFLLKWKQQTILFDPVFSETASPFSWLGGKRYNKHMPVELSQIEHIDILTISHDHYDHLDYETIKALISKVDTFLVPLGIKHHLVKWGVSENSIVELDWWNQHEINGITYTLTPAQHFSGRRFTRNTTLWGGWHLASNDYSLFFSGDTGYGDHFKQIQQRLGDVDFALLECGQYNEQWSNIHMMPEETVQAAKDLNAKVMMPVHWGAFTLSLHSWTDPIERALAEAEKQDQSIIAPEIGEVVDLSLSTRPITYWWQKYEVVDK
jgi:L-ascorbate metabolism protein UlaG (beta-lactamase superfamily)